MRVFGWISETYQAILNLQSLYSKVDGSSFGTCRSLFLGTLTSCKVSL
ncbi:hypothetical protein LINGRAHAP2_LOCUS25075 [Linum grandiflorum]